VISGVDVDRMRCVDVDEEKKTEKVGDGLYL
jgi:hypothetical protein